MSKQRFAMVSEAMLADTRLTGRQFKVLCALRMFADSKTGMAHPKRSQIADATGISEKKITDDTHALEMLGWIKKTGDGGRSTSNIYTLFDEPKTSPEMGLKPTPNRGSKTNPETGEVSEKKPPPKWVETSPEMGLKPTPNRGTNLPQNGGGQVTDHEQTIEQTNNRPVAPSEKTALVLTAPADAEAPPEKLTEFKIVCRSTWVAYAAAYMDRYDIEPVRNAKINTQVVQFCKRVPRDEAPHIAAFFVTHNSAFYVSRGHQFGNLLADAEKLRTEWATGRAMTAATARQIDSTQSNLNAIEQAVALAAGR